MNRVAFGDTELSRIILGLWRLTDYGDSSPSALQSRIEAALEQAAILAAFIPLIAATAGKGMGQVFRRLPVQHAVEV